MKTQPFVFAMAIGLLLVSRPTLAADPPVDVEIADDEAKDFFSSEPEEEEEDEPQPKDSRSRIKKNADAMFQELEANSKGAKIKRMKKSKAAGGGSGDGDEDSSSNENINQNVVNVVVVSGDKETKAEAKADAKNEAKAELPATPPVVQRDRPIDQPQAAEKPVAQAAPNSNGSCCYYGYGTWSSWWHRPKGIEGGDVLLSFDSGGYGGGLYFGAGVEGMMSSTWGIKLSANIAGFERWDDHGRWYNDDNGPRLNHGDWDFFLGGRPVVPAPSENRAVSSAFLHLEDLVLTMHMGDGEGFDIVPSFGVSHYGYHIEESGEAANGGSMFLRAGAAAQYVYKRFFFGVDFGWYPVEIFRYGLVTNERGEDRLEQMKIDDSTDNKRVTFQLMFGVSL